MNNSLAFVQETLKRSLVFFKTYKAFFIKLWVILLSLDLLNYFLQMSLTTVEQGHRSIEITYQLILVFFTVFLLHAFHRLEDGHKDFDWSQALGSSILLTPGFVLQSIFWFLSVLIGSVLLVLPGLYCFVVFIFAPVVAVLRPDYEGKIFFYTRELFQSRWKEVILVFLIVTPITLIPQGLHLLVFGSVRSAWSWILAPVDSAIFLGAELVTFQYVYSVIFKGSAPKTSS